MNGAFSYPPLKTLLQTSDLRQKIGLEIVAVFLPASSVSGHEFEGSYSILPKERPQSDLPLIQPYLAENIIHLAWANQIPVYLVQSMKEAAVFNFVNSLQPDIACVACFSQLIPEEVLSLPKHGFLNIHPSLLPDHRGPDPLFWIFRSGDQDRTAVTLHWMDEGLDTGDILSQRPISLPDGITGPEADILCATLGGEMLLEGLELIATGQAPRRPQPAGGSYQPHPTTEAFTLDLNWPARRAFNFMRGTAEWNHPYTLHTGSKILKLRTADSYHPTQKISQPHEERDGRYLIQFSSGTLLAYSFP
jgi:methionyl-tRNA formyltransferase